MWCTCNALIVFITANTGITCYLPAIILCAVHALTHLILIIPPEIGTIIRLVL